MVEVFLDDGGGDQLSVAYRLVILVVVWLVGVLQLLPKLDEEAGNRLDHRVLAVLVKEIQNNLFMVAHDFAEGLDAELSIVIAEVLEHFLQHVGGLAHGRNH